MPSPFGVLNFDTSDIHKKMGFFTLKCGISVLLKGYICQYKVWKWYKLGICDRVKYISINIMQNSRSSPQKNIDFFRFLLFFNYFYDNFTLLVDVRVWTFSEYYILSYDTQHQVIIKVLKHPGEVYLNLCPH